METPIPPHISQTLTQTLSASHQPTNPLMTLLLLLLMALAVVANCLLMVSFVAVVGLVTEGLQTSATAARATEEWQSLVL